MPQAAVRLAHSHVGLGRHRRRWMSACDGLAMRLPSEDRHYGWDYSNSRQPYAEGMEAADAYVAGLVSVKNAQQHVESAHHLTLRRNLDEYGTQATVIRPSDTRERCEHAHGDRDQQLLAWASSRPSLVAVHDRSRELRLRREKHASVDAADSCGGPWSSWRKYASGGGSFEMKGPRFSGASRCPFGSLDGVGGGTVTRG